MGELGGIKCRQEARKAIWLTILDLNIHLRGLPWWSTVAKTLCFQCWGHRFKSLVGELIRSHVLCGVAKINK